MLPLKNTFFTSLCIICKHICSSIYVFCTVWSYEKWWSHNSDNTFNKEFNAIVISYFYFVEINIVTVFIECGQGEYSESGYAPCRLCEMDTYQDA